MEAGLDRSWSGHWEEQKDLCPLPDIKPLSSSPQPVMVKKSKKQVCGMQEGRGAGWVVLPAARKGSCAVCHIRPLVPS